MLSCKRLELFSFGKKKISLTGIGESVPNGDFSNEKNKKMQLLDLVIATAV
jgi:hypothetical protein